MSHGRLMKDEGLDVVWLGNIAPVFKSVLSRPSELMDCIEPVEKAKCVPNLRTAASRIMKIAEDEVSFGRLKGCGLNPNEVATIMLYSAEDTDPPFYADMNRRCNLKDRTQVVMYAKYMWALLTALRKLPAYTGHQVFRGVRRDLRWRKNERGEQVPNYQKDRLVVWYGWTSTTKSIEALKQHMFCGKSGPRSIIMLTLTQEQGRDISRHSIIGGEAEVILPPGTTIKIMSVLDQKDGLVLFQCEEMTSNDWIMDLRGDSAPNSLETPSRVDPVRSSHASSAGSSVGDPAVLRAFPGLAASSPMQRLLDKLSLVVVEASGKSSNAFRPLADQCFYLSLARSYAGPIPELRRTAQMFKKLIEDTVFKQHPAWAEDWEVGPEVQTYSDFLRYAMADANSQLAPLAALVVDTARGYVQIFRGATYDKVTEHDKSMRATNLMLLWYTPGHYQCLLSSGGSGTAKPELTLQEWKAVLESEGIQYVENSQAYGWRPLSPDPKPPPARLGFSSMR